MPNVNMPMGAPEPGGYREDPIAQAALALEPPGTVQAKPYVQEQYNRVAAQREISKGGAVLAQINTQLNTAWNSAVSKAAPDDPNIANSFRAMAGPILDKFQQSFTTPQGQVWAAEQAERLRLSLDRQITADQSTMAGAALENHLATVGNESVAAVRENPAALDATLQMMEGTITGLVQNAHGLDPKQAALVHGKVLGDMQAEAVRAAVAGIAEKNPQAALKFLQDDKYGKYLSEQDQEKLLGYVQHQEAFQRAEARANEAQMNKQQDDAYNAAQAHLVGSLIDPQTGAVREPGPGYYKAIAQIAQMPRAKAGNLQSLLHFGRGLSKSMEEQAAKPIVASDPAVYSNLLARAQLPADNPDHLTPFAVLQAEADRKLSHSDTGILLHLSNANLGGIKQSALLKSEFGRAEAIIQGNTRLLPNAAIKAKWEQFKADTLRILADAHGNTAPYLDPKSPEYLFSMDRMKQYRPTPGELSNPATVQVVPGNGIIAPPKAAPPARRPLSEFFGAQDPEAKKKADVLFWKNYSAGKAS